MNLIDRWVCRQCNADVKIVEQINHRQEIARRYKEGHESDELGIRPNDIVEETDSYTILDKSFHARDCIRYENPKEDSVLFVDRYTKEAQALVFRHG